MVEKISYKINNKKVKLKYNYIPFRYFFTSIVTVLEGLLALFLMGYLCYKIPYVLILIFGLHVGCVIKLISSDDNPDYKLPWLFFVLILPVVGAFLYIILYSRHLKKKFIRKLEYFHNNSFDFDDEKIIKKLEEENPIAASQAKLLCNTAVTHLYNNTKQTYFDSGEEVFKSMAKDLKDAKDFIYVEYFIIKCGVFWGTILEILREKVAQGLDVKVIYDDIGCMKTLPGDYYKILNKMGIDATTFSRLHGHVDNEVNNRNHRKIMIIDGKIAYTGGLNIADEYINKKQRFGHWKDNGIRLEGQAVWEFTKLFWTDFGINVKTVLPIPKNLYPKSEEYENQGYIVPFGDGPAPIYQRGVSKALIQSMLANATKYAYITTPYLIIDNDTCQSIEDAALRGVDIKIIVPHIPDKKVIFQMSRSYYYRLMKAGVKICEYEIGFVHAKTYLVDDKIAMLGTVNLDYRSLVHHFENAVWLYDSPCILDIKKDVEKTLEKCIYVEKSSIKLSPIKRLIRAILRLFAPLM